MPASRRGRVPPDEVEAGLRRAAADGLRPEVRAAHMARIRVHAAALGPPRARSTHWPQPLRPAWSRAAAAVGAVALVSVLGVGGAAWASQDALPGEPLHVLKTITEHVSALLHPTAERATDHLLVRAERRLEETAGLLDGGTDGGLVADAAHEALLARAALRAAGDADLEARVAYATAVGVARLDVLLADELPETAGPQARDSLQAVLDRLAEQARDQPTTWPPAGRPVGTPPGVRRPPPADEPVRGGSAPGGPAVASRPRAGRPPGSPTSRILPCRVSREGVPAGRRHRTPRLRAGRAAGGERRLRRPGGRTRLFGGAPATRQALTLAPGPSVVEDLAAAAGDADRQR